mgnify:CR=1 FL=1
MSLLKPDGYNLSEKTFIQFGVRDQEINNFSATDMFLPLTGAVTAAVGGGKHTGGTSELAKALGAVDIVIYDEGGHDVDDVDEDDGENFDVISEQMQGTKQRKFDKI